MTKQYFCPNCRNELEFTISEDYYLKDKKMFKPCEVCGWTKSDSIKTVRANCINGCDGVRMFCSKCPI